MNQQDQTRLDIAYEYALARKRRPFSLLERQLWALAMEAPYGSMIIPDFQNPYLLRTYLSPEKDELVAMLLRAGASNGVANLVKVLPRPYLHYFFRGDDDRAFHNHPWEGSWSFVLTGGYIDHRWDFVERRSRARVVRPGQFNRIDRNDYHKVELHPGQNCWTLFFSGRRVHKSDGTDWDFFEPTTGVFTPWGQYVDRAARGQGS